jgi:predicted ATPase
VIEIVIFFIKMPRPAIHPDPRTKIAVDLIQNDPTQTVPEAMQAAGFSIEESQDRAKQMWIRRRIPPRRSCKSHPPSPSAAAANPKSAYRHDLYLGRPTDPLTDSQGLAVTDELDGGCSGSDASGSSVVALQYDLRAWISFNRDNMQVHCNSILPMDTKTTISMQRAYLEKCVQILLSLAGKIIGAGYSDSNINMVNSGGGDKKVLWFHPDFITPDNIIVSDPTASLGFGDSGELSVYFIRCDDSLDCRCNEVEEINNKYVAMHAFARIAYDMCMMGNGPRLPDMPLGNGTSQVANVPLHALSLQYESGAVGGTGADDGDDEEDKILDVMRKKYRPTESDDDNYYSVCMSAMVDAGIPLSMRRFIADLLGDEHGGIFRSEHKFASFEDVVSDLTQMIDNPDKFLHGSVPDRWKLDFGDKLYGRDVELAALLNAANRVVRNIGGDACGSDARSKLSVTEVVMVSGTPGAGKSRLVKFGGTQLKKRGWCFLQSKFDRVVHPEPLSVLAHAFDEYFRCYAHCPNQGNDDSSGAANSDYSYPGRSQQLHDRLTSFISPEGLDILATYIPSLRCLMDLALPAVMPDVNESLMTALFGALLHVISSEKSPIMFFVDDLQWADPLSLSLIVALVKEAHSRSLQLSVSCADSQCAIIDDKDMHILFVGSYREYAVVDNQPLAKALRELQNDDSINMTAISLSGMSLETLNELLSGALSLPNRRVRQLSELVIQKTCGLPLFVIEFVRALTTDNLLTHNFTRGWEWDANFIEIFPITESVAELFALKLRRLPKDILLGLQIISIFGTQVEQQIVNLVLNYDGENSVDIPLAINVAQSEGLIERAASIISFTHDLIQKATIDSICDDDLVPLLRKLISALVKEASATNSLDSLMFVVVDLINRIGNAATNCPHERERFAELNLRAGTKAVAVPDFAGAAVYAENGIALLSNTCWETQYDLSLRLHEIAILSHFSNQHSCDRVLLMTRISTVFEQAHNFSDKFKTHRIWTRLLSLSNFSEAIEESLRALEELGESFDLACIDNSKVCEELEKQKERFSGESESLLARSLKDPCKKNAMKIMSSLILYYTQSKSYLGAFVSCRMIEITMKHGYCEESIIGTVAFAASLVSSLGDIDGGYDWGRKAMTLMNICGKQSHIPTISLGLFGTVFAWTNPIQSTLDYLAQGIRTSFVYGDVEFAMVNTYVYIARSFNCGKSIKVLMEEVEALARQHGICLDTDDIAPFYSPEILQFYMLPVYNILRDLQEVDHIACQWRLVRNYNLLDIAIKKEQFACFHAVITNLTVVEFLRRDMGNALKCTDMYHEHFKARSMQTYYVCTYNVFYDGLINFYFMGQTGNSRYLERGEHALSKMTEWVRHSDWNFRNKLLLMQAEFYRITKDVKKAAVCYEASIVAAREHKFIHEEGMANELAGIFYLELGSRQRSYSYFKQSVVCYQKWGASVIASRIEATIDQEFSLGI